MSRKLTRRYFFGLPAAGMLVAAGRIRGAQQGAPAVPAPPVFEYKPRSVVSLVQGDNRQANVYKALVAVDDQIRPKLAAAKRVLIKPNNVGVEEPLCATHADTLRAILEYLGPRFKGPVTIAESSARDTWTGFRNYKYPEVIQEYRSRKVELVDLNEEGKFVLQPILDRNLHLIPVRLAARLVEPGTFVISAAIPKSHNYVVATLSIKNMVIGAPLHSMNASGPGAFHHKRLYHAGFHVMHYNMLRTAERLQPNWGVAVLDGFEGMEGNGPRLGTAVPHRIAMASTDFLAADRVGLECMGVEAGKVGYLQYCGQMGMGNYDLARIDLRGPAIASVRREYKMHEWINEELQWMQPVPFDDFAWPEIGDTGTPKKG
ncbi:MAG TPA: DUF362 domain-containing protein [Bryobacteraceae bacterium]|nr:DUF362 domain-containing protein [Bryobacteraceae bacterium]